MERRDGREVRTDVFKNPVHTHHGERRVRNLCEAQSGGMITLRRRWEKEAVIRDMEESAAETF